MLAPRTGWSVSDRRNKLAVTVGLRLIFYRINPSLTAGSIRKLNNKRALLQAKRRWPYDAKTCYGGEIESDTEIFG